MMEVISILLNAALVGVTAWLCYVISTSKLDPIFTDAHARDTRCFSEILQRLERIENAQHMIIEQKAALVSDAVDEVIAGNRPVTFNPNCSDRVAFGGSVDDVDPAGIGFEVSRGTPFQKEQRATGNAVSAGIPHGIIEPKFKVGDIVHRIGEHATTVVQEIAFNPTHGYMIRVENSELFAMQDLFVMAEGS